MARRDGKDRGIVLKKDAWWVRIYVNGRERWHRADNKSQAKALYGRLKADIREGKYFPEKFAPAKDITLRTWIARYLEGSTNRGVENERRYGRRWSLLLGKRLLSQITTEELRRIQAQFKAKDKWGNGTINRHFAFLRHVLMLAMKDDKLSRNPVSGIKFLPEERRTGFSTKKNWPIWNSSWGRMTGSWSPSPWKLAYAGKSNSASAGTTWTWKPAS